MLVVVVVGRYGSKYLKSEIKTTKTERSDEAIDSKLPTDDAHTTSILPLSPFPFHDPKAANKLLSFGRLGDSTLCLMNGIYNRRGVRERLWREVP